MFWLILQIIKAKYFFLLARCIIIYYTRDKRQIRLITYHGDKIICNYLDMILKILKNVKSLIRIYSLTTMVAIPVHACRSSILILIVAHRQNIAQCGILPDANQSTAIIFYWEQNQFQRERVYLIKTNLILTTNEINYLTYCS